MVRYVDHAIIAVDDLEAAAHDYEARLGFAVSAGGTHPAVGTRNRLVVLDPDYVELIARTPGTGLAPTSAVTPMFARAPGTIGFALACDDIDAEVTAIRARGLAVNGPREGRLEGPGGAARGWRMAAIEDDPQLGMEAWRLPFLIQHDSVGEERRRRLTAPDGPRSHPLRARSMAHVTVAVSDLTAGLRAYAQAFGLEPEGEEGRDEMLQARTARLPLAHGAIVLAAPLGQDGPLARGLRAQGEGLFSIAVAVDDLQGAVDGLRGRGAGVRVEEPNGLLLAARPDLTCTHGARLELVPGSQ